MFRCKKDVDRHVTDALSKIHNEYERNQRGYTFARLYYQVKDYDTAKKYLAGYLSIRDYHAPSHKLMGQIYEATGNIEKALQSYKRSLQIDSNQKDLVLKICDLYCKVPVDHETSKYWADRADQLFPHNEVVFRLRECIVGAEGEPDRNELEKLISTELASQPMNLNLHIKLLRLYLDTERIKEAYDYALKLEKKRPFPSSTEWYYLLVDIFEAYQEEYAKELTSDFYMFFLTVLDRLLFLTIVEPHAVSHEWQAGNEQRSCSITDASSVLLTFDQQLKKATEQDIKSGEWLYFLHHMKGQIYFRMATLLLKRARKDQGNWKEACRFAAALFLVGYTFKPTNLLHEVWFSQLDDQQKLFTNFFQQGALRTSFIGHVIMSLCKEDKGKWLQKIKQDVCVPQVRERLYNRLFGNLNQKQAAASSFFMNDRTFFESSFEFPTQIALMEYDNAVYKLCPNSLHHLVWLNLHQENKDESSKSLCEAFKGLQYSNKNLSNGSPESLCQLDIESYLQATLYTASMLLDQRNVVSNSRNGDNPLAVPPDIADPLCTKEQSQWWQSAHGLVNNTIKEKLGEHRRTLQRGLEIIRGVGNHGLEVQLIVHLAHIFADRAAALRKVTTPNQKTCKQNEKVTSDKITGLEHRAVHYWNVALGMLEKLAARQAVRLPKDRMFTGYSKDPSEDYINTLREEGQLYIACHMMNNGKLEEAAARLEKLSSAYAAFYLALAYKKSALQDSHSSTTHSILLNKAKDALYLTMDRIKGDSNHSLNQELYIEIEAVESEIAKDMNCANADDSANSEDADECTDELDSSFQKSLKNRNSNHMMSFITKHSTPISSSNFSTPKSKYRTAVDGHLEPSPERLDAQIRALAMTQSTLIKTLLEQQRTLVDTNKAIVDELKQNKEVVEQLKKQLEELHISNVKVHHKAANRRPAAKHHGGDEEEKDYNEYDVNGYLDYYVDDSVDDYRSSAYNYEHTSRMVHSDTAAMGYVPPTPLPAGPPPPLTHYGYQYPPPPPHAGLAPPPPPGAIPETPHYYHAALGHALPFSEGQQLPQFRFHVATPIVKPPVPTSIPSVPQPLPIATLPPPSTVAFTQPPPAPSQQPQLAWTKSGTVPHAFQIPLPSTIIPMSTWSQTPTTFTTAASFVQTTAVNQTKPPPIFTPFSVENNSPSGSHLKSLLTNSVSGSSLPMVTASPTTAVSGTSPAVSKVNETPPSNRSRQDSDVYSDTDIEREVMGDFEPVIPLPAEVVVETGEEGEEVLFEDRAKLFRFIDREWKERGVGTVKILKSETSEKIRLLMRRDKILKVCANHSILPTMEIHPMKGSDRAWTWAAQDFADEEVKPEQFCIRFKTAEIANSFKEAFENAVNLSKQIKVNKDSSTDRSHISVDGTVIAAAHSSPLSSKFLPKSGSWSCTTCYVSNPAEKETCIACDSKKPAVFTQSKSQLTVAISSSGITKPTENLCNFEGKSSVYQSPVISINETLGSSENKISSNNKNISFQQPLSNSFVFHSPVNTIAKTSTVNELDKPKAIFGSFSFPSPLFSEKSSSEASTITVQGADIKESAVANRLHFGGYNFTSSPVITEQIVPVSESNMVEKSNNTAEISKVDTKPTFGTFTFSSTPVVSESTPATKDREILVVSTKSKSGPQVTKVDTSKSSPFSGFSFKSSSAASFNSLSSQADNKTESLNINVVTTSSETKTDSEKVFGSNSSVSNLQFSLLSNTKSGFQSASTFQGFPSAGSPLFVTVTKDGRRVSGEHNGDNNAPEDFIPTAEFKPVVPLPALIDIKTGEEDEEKIFGERAKLFRFDSEGKQWKERGIGELKILYQKSLQKYRVLMRREQVFKICANHYILPEMNLTPLQSSDRAWVWVAQDFSDGDLQAQQFAAKFKNADVANQFRTAFENCQNKLKAFQEKPEETVSSNKSHNVDNVKTVFDHQVQREQKTKNQTDINPCFGSKSTFSELFKPASGSWECKSCYVINDAAKTICISCSTSKLGSEQNITSNLPETTVSNKPISELFRPEVGSWECKACYIRNSKNALICVACETPKPGTSATQPSGNVELGKNIFATSGISNNPATTTKPFTFGNTEIPLSTTSSGFIFGTKESQPSPTFKFGMSSLSTSSNFGFKPSQNASSHDNAGTFFGGTSLLSSSDNKTDSSKSPVVPSVSSSSAFVFGSSGTKFTFSENLVQKTTENKPSGDPVEFRFGSPQKYEFNFSGVTPRSPPKWFKSPKSPGTPTDVEEEEEVEPSDVDNIYFQPVIPLPPKVAVKTGEEDEILLFSKRAKLFRFTNGEWKERGIGDVKILRSESPKRIRLLMRRDQVLKVCLNHHVTKDIIFTWKGDKSLSWAAVDFSENEPSLEQFAIRFKSQELAVQFKDALENAVKSLDNIEDSEASTTTSEDSISTKNLPRQEFSFSFNQTLEESTKSGFPLTAKFQTTQPVSDSAFISKSNISNETSTVSQPALNALSSFSFTLPGNENKTPPSSFSLASRFGTGSSPTSLFGNKVPVFSLNSSNSSVAKVENDQDSEIEIVYQATPSEEQIASAKALQLPPTFYLYENKPLCPGCRGCTDDIPSDKVKEESMKKEEKPNPSFIPEKDNTIVPTTEADVEPLSLFSNTSLSTFSFADLAAKKSGFEGLASTSPSKAVFPGAGAPVFGSIGCSNDSEEGDVVQAPDIHFEPVIPLPDIVDVKTGEEDEIPVFCHRAKLYRYDTTVSQWKERGIGDFKILKHREQCRFRLLLRREQVHKVACNHYITANLKMEPLKTSETSLFWYAVDFSEGQPETCQFAIKFKTKDIMQQFLTKFDECKATLASGQTGTNQLTTTGALPSSVTSESSDTTAKSQTESTFSKSAEHIDSCSTQPTNQSQNDYDEDDNEDDDDEEDDDDILYEKRISFEIYDESSQCFQNAGLGMLQVMYNDTVFGYRIVVTSDKEEVLCDHIIAIQTSIYAEKKSVTWAAVDVSIDPPKRRKFRATFSSAEALAEFCKVFEEGKQAAIKSEIVEKSDNLFMAPEFSRTIEFTPAK